jgi:hypothetical protein
MNDTTHPSGGSNKDLGERLGVAGDLIGDTCRDDQHRHDLDAVLLPGYRQEYPATRQIVGWSTADHLKAGLCTSAVVMTLQPWQPDKGLIHHSVRGFLAGLAKKEITVGVLGRVRQVGRNKQGAKGSYTV